MRFYRQLTSITAITFDLDDTLYDNRPVIAKTEKKLLNFIRCYDDRLNKLQFSDFKKYQTLIFNQYPEIYHDVTHWRWLAVKALLCHYGYDLEQSVDGANDIIAHFSYWRSKIVIPELTHKTLSTLAEKVPLAVITNGNADPYACGLGDYFQFVLKAGQDGRAKPFSDMYYLAAQKFNIVLDNILHVGDSLTTDIQGALHSGMQACWINANNSNLLTNDNKILPHVEITGLASLIALI
ncbi:Flavin mononucleotide phosphatase YigB [Arsenophonus endosymbiont of Aleurodicus dispersus]|uniref:5-amino-6-(5-phospho-D-ribitylamino)uracil phosphatase YigB n=1 Tax=Arsenophonus endosymbiont of Aleurodicus dispersus TaxID=235559 RepID=UPI000EB23A4E|nr:5-amino-6-(5-phospho-D-ribitylamino)uracil phosphatase YigB [Arsenophonus endosymbiont of Aleurodicus dispersus]VAY02420.1 Flavin mononucleotide phosphatase YigB [Arsenophonus endosymbiont of Aleurodicus dispersus]